VKEVYDFLKDAEIFYVATVEGDQPRVRPFGAVNIFENKMYLQTGNLPLLFFPTSIVIGFNSISPESLKAFIFCILNEFILFSPNK